MENVTIRAVIFQDGDLWVAQCLEHDISAQAKTVAEAYRRLAMTIRLEREMTTERGSEAFAGISAAPLYFHGLYSAAPGAYRPETNFDNFEAKLAA